jgi:serine/threonine-protein kinase
MFVAGGVLALGLSLYGYSLASANGKSGNVAEAPPTLLSAPGKCVVSYAVKSDEGGKFAARVTLANRDEVPINNWSLWFILPNNQLITDKGKARLAQDGNTVTVKSKAPLGGLKTITMDIKGSYTEGNQPPLAFQLNSRTCDAFVSPKPGEPVRAVERQGGTDRLSVNPTSSNPLPGVSIDPTGGVTITPTTKPTNGTVLTVGPTATVTTTKTTKPVVDPLPPDPTPSTAEPTTEQPSIEVTPLPTVATPTEVIIGCDTPDRPDLCAEDGG